MSYESRGPETEHTEDSPRGGFSRDPLVLRMAATICVGLLQGVIVYFMKESDQRWGWYMTVSLSPLPFLLAEAPSKRIAAASVPWIALLLLLDSGRIFFKSPYVEAGWSGLTIILMAYTGVLLLLPSFVSWIDGEGVFPEWRSSFRRFSQIFFASALACLFLLILYPVCALGFALVGMVTDGVSSMFLRHSKWFLNNFMLSAFVVCDVVFYWTAKTRKLLDALERYVLAIFSCFLPILSLFVLTVIAALPMGVDKLWRRGFNSEIILNFFLAIGLCVLTAWQGGEGRDGKPRDPFFKRVNTLVRISLIALPIFGPLLIYTIGLRVSQYGWTVDRVISMTLAAAFGLWSAAWSFFLVRRWKDWPRFYGKVNRIAFPVLGAVLVLLSSPVCDVRRIVLHERFEWLRESVEAGGADSFDWGYIARNLGVYGVRAMEELIDGGDAAVREKLGKGATQADVALTMKKITEQIDRLKEEKKNLDWSRNRINNPQPAPKTTEDFIKSARTAPVFGGILEADEKERIVRGLSAGASKGALEYGLRYGKGEVDYFCLADLNGDGQKEILLGLGMDIYLIRGNSAFMLERGWVNGMRNGEETDNKEAISADEQRIIRNGWGILNIYNRIYIIDPDDVDDIESRAVNNR